MILGCLLCTIMFMNDRLACAMVPRMPDTQTDVQHSAQVRSELSCRKFRPRRGAVFARLLGQLCLSNLNPSFQS